MEEQNVQYAVSFVRVCVCVWWFLTSVNDGSAQWNDNPEGLLYKYSAARCINSLIPNWISMNQTGINILTHHLPIWAWRWHPRCRRPRPRCRSPMDFSSQDFFIFQSFCSSEEIEQCWSLWVGCILIICLLSHLSKNPTDVIKLYLHPIWVSKHSKSTNANIDSYQQNVFQHHSKPPNSGQLQDLQRGKTSPAVAGDIPLTSTTCMGPSWTYPIIVNVIEIV